MSTTLHKSSGFTLIEVLCATMVGGAVVALGGLIAVQSVSTSRSVGKELQDRWFEARIVEQFRNDVRSAIVMMNEKDSAFKLPAQQGQILEITGLATIPNSHSISTQRLPSRILYIEEKNEIDEKSLRLVRQVESLLEADAPGVFREVLAEGLRAVSVRKFIEGEWGDRLSQSNPPNALPAGLRLTLRWRSQDRPATVCTALVATYQEKNERGRK